MEPVIADENDQIESGDGEAGEKTDGEDGGSRTPAQPSPTPTPQDEEPDLFDGYSFKGRHSVLFEDDDDEDADEEDESEGDEQLVEVHS